MIAVENPMGPVIEVRSLVKHYKDVQALKGLSLAIEQGQIYGLLGRNGAGKTTLVKLLLSIVRPTSGEAFLLGEPVGSVAVRKRVGYLPEDHRFPDYHTGRSLLDFYGTLVGMNSRDRAARIPPMLELVGLQEAADRKIRTYSKGMKQRLGLAQALLHDPEVLFLDEPTDGVDPVGRKQIRDLLVELKKKGKTILINSHLLLEVEMISDRVGILELGSLRREGSVQDLMTRKDSYELKLEGGFDKILPEIERRVRGLRRVDGGIEVDVEDRGKLDALIDFLRGQGISLTGMTQKRQSLEDIFIQTVGEARVAT